MVGEVGPNTLRIEPIVRFVNQPQRQSDGLHWDTSSLYRNITAGLFAAAHQHPTLGSIGVDSWAIDYALLKNGRVLDQPFHYRDERSFPWVEKVHSTISPEELYERNGLQHLPFTTLYQLMADREAGRLENADQFLMIPDLITRWLTGRSFAEVTNASTTGLLSVRTHRWDSHLLSLLGLRESLFPPLLHPGDHIGNLTKEVSDVLGTRAVSVVAVASHDTASAVVAVPALNEEFAYISCGTWGLVGVELEAPVLTEASRAANFTNECGVDGSVRFLKNVAGLWLLNETIRHWATIGPTPDLNSLLAQAAHSSEDTTTFDVNDPLFLQPGDMQSRIASWLTARELAVPVSRAGVVKCIVQSLALAFAGALREAGELSGKRINVVHLVGGGAQNSLLCQAIADRAGLPVLAGPVESTAIGNMLIQARGMGLIHSDLFAMRHLIATNTLITRFSPSA